MPRSRHGGDHRLERPIPDAAATSSSAAASGPALADAAPAGPRPARRPGPAPDRSAPRRAAARRRAATAARAAPAGCRAPARAWPRRPRGARSASASDLERVRPGRGREGDSRPRRPPIRSVLLAGPGRDQQRGADVVEAARGVAEALGRGSVEPVRVVDQDQERRGPRAARADQAEEPGEHRQPLVDHALAGRQRQRGRDRRGLRLGQVAEPVEHRRAELAEGREREPRLRLDARRSSRPASPRRARPAGGEQRGLADPGLAADDQRAAATGPRRVQQRFDPIEFGFPSDQHAVPTLGDPAPGGKPACVARELHELGVHPVLYRRAAA